MVETATRSQAADPISRRLGVIALELALLGAVWSILKLDEVLALAIAAVIVAAGLLPAAWSGIASGVGMLALAALAWLYYGAAPVALVLAIFGAVSLAGAAAGRRI